MDFLEKVFLMLVMSRQGLDSAPRSLEEVRDDINADLEILPPQNPRVPVLRRLIIAVEAEIARKARQRARV